MAAARKKDVSKAVAEAAGEAISAAPPRGRPSDALGGDIRRRDIFPLLVLHLVGRSGESYGNELIHAIEEMTRGAISVNPNTMYPLLRDMEERGLVSGRWEHPEKRTRRYYSITEAGTSEHQRLLGEVAPFLDRTIDALTRLRSEVFGAGSN